MLPGLLAVGFAAPALAAPGRPLGRFEQLRDEDLRVARVAYRLSTANAGLCGTGLAPQSGLVLHSIEQYGFAERSEAARRFGLGDRVGIMAVVDGSPAAKAGLAAGDRLVAVNGRAFGTLAVGPVPTRASVDRALAVLAQEMALGPVMLRVSGAGGERNVRLAAAMGCPASVELLPGNEVNAWADGARVMVSHGLLRRCASDNDLAIVIGHEMAHNLLRHRARRAERVSANRLLPLADSASPSMRETEEEADRLAVRLATGAGYDLSGAEAFLGGLLASVPPAPSHPAPERRLALLRAAIAEAL